MASKQRTSLMQAALVALLLVACVSAFRVKHLARHAQESEHKQPGARPPCYNEQVWYCPDLRPPISPSSLFNSPCFQSHLHEISSSCRAVYDRWQAVQPPKVPPPFRPNAPDAQPFFPSIGNEGASDGDGDANGAISISLRPAYILSDSDSSDNSDSSSDSGSNSNRGSGSANVGIALAGRVSDSESAQELDLAASFKEVKDGKHHGHHSKHSHLSWVRRTAGDA